MIGKLHMRTLFGPPDSAGSSFATDASGVGENHPACCGSPGSETSIACSPPECQESKIRSLSTVVLCRSLNSPMMCGRRGWAMFQSRAQPQGQPNDGTVNVP